LLNKSIIYIYIFFFEKFNLDYEDNNSSSLTTVEQNSTSFDDDDDDDDEDEEGSSDDDETISDDESNNIHSITNVTTPCTITQRRHSDTIQTSYSSPIVKRRCTYSSMHDDEQKRSVLVESYRKLRGIKKPKLQVSLLICNLIKRLEKTFTKTPPLPRQQSPLPPQQQQQQQQQHVQYYQHRTTYRSSSSDSIYMSTSSSLVNDEIETTTIAPINQQYSPPHSSNYDSDKVLLPVGDLRSSHSMYHPSSTDAYWLAQSNFAIPVVSTSDDDDVDVSLQGGGDYLDLSDNTLASSFSTCSSSSSSSVSSPSSSSSELISNDCCCSSSTSSPTITKHLVDTNNNSNDDYYVYHHHNHHHHLHHHSQLHSNQDLHSNHHLSTTTEQAFFYHHNGTNNVDIITTA
jgi:hypothetical protein